MSSRTQHGGPCIRRQQERCVVSASEQRGLEVYEIGGIQLHQSSAQQRIKR